MDLRNFTQRKVFDSKKLHLLSHLTKALGYKLRYKIGGEYGYEFTICTDQMKTLGLPPDILAGGAGYSTDEAIENLFLDCAGKENLLGTSTNKWIEFYDEAGLEVALTLMGCNPAYEPVVFTAYDFDKWEYAEDEAISFSMKAPMFNPVLED